MISRKKSHRSTDKVVKPDKVDNFLSKAEQDTLFRIFKRYDEVCNCELPFWYPNY